MYFKFIWTSVKEILNRVCKIPLKCCSKVSLNKTILPKYMKYEVNTTTWYLKIWLLKSMTGAAKAIIKNMD